MRYTRITEVEQTRLEGSLIRSGNEKNKRTFEFFELSNWVDGWFRLLIRGILMKEQERLFWLFGKAS